MSASGFTPIQLYRSTTAAAVPLAANLAAGELAINLTDEKLYFENASGVVKVLADSTYVGTVTSVNASGGTTGMTFSGGPVTGIGTLTLAGTLAVANGGTGVTTSTGTGSVVLSASPSFTGTVNFGPSIITGTGLSTGDAQLELGGNRSGSGLAYLDLHATAGGDFNSRLIRYAGANGGMDLIQTGTGGMGISNEGNSDISFKTNAIERMRINNAGNVGIGTASPGVRLDVSGNARVTNNSSMQFRNFAGTGTANFTLQSDDNFVVTNAAGTPIQSFTQAANAFAVYGGNANNRMIVDSGSNIVYWNVNGSERMRIDASGNVMVGTTSATGLFSVAGVSYGQMVATDRFGVFGNNLYFGGGGGGDFRYIGNGHAYGWTQGNTDGADLRLLYAGNNTSGGGAVATTSERIYITAAGNVGIGTSSPGSKLDVAGDINASNYQILGSGASQAGTVGFLNSNGPSVQFWGSSSAQSGAMIINTAGTERMRIASNGFVGVGTSTDNGIDKLTVAGIVGSYISGRAGFHLYNGGATAEWFIGQPSASSHNLTFSKLVSGTYTDYVAIDSTGNVGIGNISPTVKLDVTGGIKTSRTAVTAPATSDGNIFSGTYTPTLTNSTNVDISNSTAYTCQYMRVGDVVTVSGRVSIAVIGTGITRLNMTLPVSSNFSAEENCAGTAQVSYVGVSTNLAAQIKADTTNDRAQILYYGNVTGSAQDFFFAFTYRII